MSDYPSLFDRSNVRREKEREREKKKKKEKDSITTCRDSRTMWEKKNRGGKRDEAMTRARIEKRDDKGRTFTSRFTVAACSFNGVTEG